MRFPPRTAFLSSTLSSLRFVVVTSALTLLPLTISCKGSDDTDKKSDKADKSDKSKKSDQSAQADDENKEPSNTDGANSGTDGEKPAAKKHSAIEGYHSYDEEADGEKQIQLALTQAGISKKNVLLMFGGNWCKWCRAFDQLAQSNAEIKQILDNNFVFTHINSDTNSKIDEKYGKPFRLGFPVFMVLDAKGRVLHTQESGSLENEDKSVGHDPKKVANFLQLWGVTPLGKEDSATGSGNLLPENAPNGATGATGATNNIINPNGSINTNNLNPGGAGVPSNKKPSEGNLLGGAQ